MITRPGHPTWWERPGRSPTRAGWWWTAPAWARAAAASPAPPEVSASLAAAGCSVLFILTYFFVSFLTYFHPAWGRKVIPSSALCSSLRGMAVPWDVAGSRRGRGACVVPQSPFTVWEHPPELVIRAGDKVPGLFGDLISWTEKGLRNPHVSWAPARHLPGSQGNRMAHKMAEFSPGCPFLCFQGAFWGTGGCLLSEIPFPTARSERLQYFLISFSLLLSNLWIS